MDDEACHPRGGAAIDQAVEALLGILIVHAQTALDRRGDADGGADGGHAFRDQLRRAHQAGAEVAALHAIGRAADIEVDLVVAKVLADARGGGQGRRLGAAQL